MNREEFHQKLIDESEQLAISKSLNKYPYKEVYRVILHYLVKAVKLAKGIDLLCKNKQVSNAKILLRTLYEVFCFCEYIDNEPEDIERDRKAENRLILFHIEEKETLNREQKCGSVDINRCECGEEEKKRLRENVIEAAKRVNTNYKNVLDVFRKRDQEYTNLPEKKLVGKIKEMGNGIKKEISEMYDKVSETGNLGALYHIFVFRDCSKSVHASDFEEHVELTQDKELKASLGSTEDGLVILSTSSIFLIRIMQVANSILKLGEEKLIKNLLKHNGALQKY